MEITFFSNPAHPALICHRYRHLILFTEEGGRLKGRVSPLFDGESERVIPVALTTFDQIEELLRQGHLPQIGGEELSFTPPLEGPKGRLFLQEVDRAIDRLCQEEVEAARHPDPLYCPVTHELFRDPYSNQFGHTFEREVITKIYQEGSKKPLCPVSRQEMTTPPTPNYPLRETIDRIRSTPPVPRLPAMESRAPATDPDRANRFRQMAEEEWKEGHKEGAIALLVRAFEAAERSSDYLFLAQIYREGGERRKALLVHLYLARLQVMRGDLEEAWRTMQPFHQELPALYALLIGIMGKRDGACRILRREACQIGGKRALDYWEWALSLNPLSPGLFEEVCSSNPALFAALGSLYWREDRKEAARLQKRALELAPTHPTSLWAAILSGRSDLTLFRTLSTLVPTDRYALKRVAEGGDLEDIWRYIDLLAQRKENQEGYHFALQWADRWLEAQLWGPAIELLSRLVPRFQLFFRENIALKVDCLERLMTAYTAAFESNHRALKEVVDELGSYYESTENWESAIRVYQKGDHHLHSHETSLKLGRALGRRSKGEGIKFLYQVAKPLFATQEYRLVGQYMDQIREIAPLDRIEGMVDPLVAESICSQSAAVDLFRQLEEVQRELSLHTRQLEEMRKLIPFYIARGTVHPGRFFTTPSMGSHYPQGSLKNLFGISEWNHFFQLVAPISLNLEEVESRLSQNCPFIPGRSIGETHRLLFIPREISRWSEEGRRHLHEERVESIFHALSKLCSSNKVTLLSRVPGDIHDFRNNSHPFFAKQLSRAVSNIGLRSYWLLVSNEPFDRESAPPGYRKLDLVELVIAAITEYVISGHTSSPFKAVGGYLFDQEEIEVERAIRSFERNLRAVKERMATDPKIVRFLGKEGFDGIGLFDYERGYRSSRLSSRSEENQIQILKKIDGCLEALLRKQDIDHFTTQNEPIRSLRHLFREGVSIDGIISYFVDPTFLKRFRFGVKGVESGFLEMAPLDESERGIPIWGQEISFDPPEEAAAEVKTVREEELELALSHPPSSGASSSSSAYSHSDY